MLFPIPHVKLAARSSAFSRPVCLLLLGTLMLQGAQAFHHEVPVVLNVTKETQTYIDFLIIFDRSVYGLGLDGNGSLVLEGCEVRDDFGIVEVDRIWSARVWFVENFVSMFVPMYAVLDKNGNNNKKSNVLSTDHTGGFTTGDGAFLSGGFVGWDGVVCLTPEDKVQVEGALLYTLELIEVNDNVWTIEKELGVGLYELAVLYDGVVIHRQAQQELLAGETRSTIIQFQAGGEPASYPQWGMEDHQYHEFTVQLNRESYKPGWNATFSVRYCFEWEIACGCGVYLGAGDGLQIGGETFSWDSADKCIAYDNALTVAQEGFSLEVVVTVSELMHFYGKVANESGYTSAQGFTTALNLTAPTIPAGIIVATWGPTTLFPGESVDLTVMVPMQPLYTVPGPWSFTLFVDVDNNVFRWDGAELDTDPGHNSLAPAQSATTVRDLVL
eukprot:gene25791-31551_t